MAGGTGRIRVAVLVAAMLCSSSSSSSAGQDLLGPDWLKGLTASIGDLNRNIQRNVQQLNQRIGETVRENVAQAHRLTENLNKHVAAGRVQTVGANNVILSNDDGTKIVHSGRTSDGKPYVRESTDKIVGDALRHVERIYDPTTNQSKVYGYTLDLKDPAAKPVPITDAA